MKEISKEWMKKEISKTKEVKIFGKKKKNEEKRTDKLRDNYGCMMEIVNR